MSKKKNQKSQFDDNPSNLSTSKMMEKLRGSKENKSTKKLNIFSFINKEIDGYDEYNTYNTERNRYSSNAKRKVSKNMEIEKPPKKLKSSSIDKKTKKKNGQKENHNDNDKGSPSIKIKTSKAEKPKKKKIENFDFEEDDDDKEVKPSKIMKIKKNYI